MLSLALRAYEHKKRTHDWHRVLHSILEKIDKNQTVLIVAQKEEIMNSKRILLIAFNAFVLGMVISMISTGTNWDSTAVHVSSALSLGLNILFLEYIGLKGDK